MNQQVDPNANLLVAIGTLWLVGLGLAVMLQKHKWYVQASKKLVLAPFKWAWNKHQKFFWGVLAGALLLLYILSHSQPNPSP